MRIILPLFVLLFLSCKSEKQEQKRVEEHSATEETLEEGGGGIGCAMCKPEPINTDSMEIEVVRNF